MAKILCVAALFPPHVIGGAELSAFNLAVRLAARGHSVHALSVASSKDDQRDGELEDGLFRHRVDQHRRYPITNFVEQPIWNKPLWHLQDHLDPRNISEIKRVFQKVAPDFVLIHYIQGLGYNALGYLASTEIPTLYYLHDLGLVCIRMSMFRSGRNCTNQCTSCKLSTSYKRSQLKRFSKLGIASPSAANLARVEEYLPLASWPTRVLLNANTYPAPQRRSGHNGVLRVLFVGRLHVTKGTDVLLAAADIVSEGSGIELTFVGGGPMEQSLHAAAATRPWLTVTGHLSQQGVADWIGRSDVLAVPSTWAENSPGVAIHALSLGLPVLGSKVGGIPELVTHGVTGMLIPAGSVDAWSSALTNLATNDDALAELRRGAEANKARFDPDKNVEAVVDFMGEISGRQF